MSTSQPDRPGPDLTLGVAEADLLHDELLLGHVGDEPVLLARAQGNWFAVGASCTHYGVSLADGLLVGGTLRCPAHHAAFDLATGAAVRAPALRGLPCWTVASRGGRLYVGERRAAPEPVDPQAARAAAPDAVVIVGAGAAGAAAATELRSQGYTGRITLLGSEPDAPYDRPNLSKDFLAGTAPEAWLPLHTPDFYREQGIDLVTGTRAGRIDVAEREVRALNGGAYRYDRLLLATGSEPVRLPLPTHALNHVQYLRSIADARRIIRAAEGARRVVVVGASFIGLEAAAALRERGLEVHVVSPAARPLEHVLGPEAGDFIRALHEARGVVFHLGDHVAAITAEEVVLRSGRRVPADLVVVGIGVRPGVGMASWAGLRLHDGALAVDERLETSAPGVFAAGDLIAWPDPRSGRLIRSEHWVVAQRQGQAAARNMLGAGERFDAVPFFWSAHYDTTIRYVGHAERWDRIGIAGALGTDSCVLAYRGDGPDGGERTLAVATIGRDRDNLRAELAMERYDWSALDALVPSEAGAAHG